MFNNKYWTTISIGICLLALVFVTVFSIEKNQAGAEQMESLDEVFDRIGPYFKNHPELLSASLKAVKDFNSISDDDCVAKVNNVPISIAEIEFMKGLKDAFEERNSSKVHYYADTKSGYEAGQSYDCAYNHEFIAYKTPSDTIYPPEIGNGVASVNGVYLVNSSNKVVNTHSNEWRNGFLRSHIFPGGTHYYATLYSTEWLQGFPSGSYRVKVVSTFALPTYWVPWLWTSDTCYTSYF
jgi:hypothetical protein